MHRLLLVLLFYTSSALALNPPLTNRADPEIESTTGLKRRNKILLIHAVCGFLALQVVAPLGKFNLSLSLPSSATFGLTRYALYVLQR